MILRPIRDTWDKYLWEDGSNGIVVYTDAFPNHYFYVRSYLGKYYDDYGLHLVEQDAEKNSMT